MTGNEIQLSVLLATNLLLLLTAFSCNDPDFILNKWSDQGLGNVTAHKEGITSSYSVNSI